MADLDEKNASGSSKITGADSSGLETNYVDATPNGQLEVSNTLRPGGVYTNILLGTTAVEAKVGGSRLTNRTNLVVQNNSNKDIYWGYDSSVTASNGIVIGRNEIYVFEADDQTPIFIIGSQASLDVRLAESP